MQFYSSQCAYRSRLNGAAMKFSMTWKGKFKCAALSGLILIAEWGPKIDTMILHRVIEYSVFY